MLILGAGGMLGRELVRVAQTQAGVDLNALDRAALDVTNASMIRETMRRLRPTIVINAAAYTAVVSLLLFVLIQKTLGLRIRDQGEMAGLDLALHGEHGYGLLNPN